MKKCILLFGVLVLFAAALLVHAAPGADGDKKGGWKQTGRLFRSLYLDVDPMQILTQRQAIKQFELTDEQIREVRSLGSKYQNSLPKERSVSQEARGELEQAMSAESIDENTVQKIAERAILADAALERVRLQFWLEIRQRLGQETFDKIRQVAAKRMRGGEADETKRPTNDIMPPQKQQLPAKD